MKPHLQIAIALIWNSDEILLSKRLSTADHLPDVWEFPGGKIQEGETPQQATIREVQEEVGLQVEIVASREKIEWEYEKRFVTLHPFDCQITGGTLQTLEVAQVKFVPPSTLNLADFPAANARLIEELQQLK